MSVYLLPIYLSIYLLFHLCFSVYIHLSVYIFFSLFLFVFYVYPSSYACSCFLISLSVCFDMCIHLSVCLCIRRSVCLCSISRQPFYQSLIFLSFCHHFLFCFSLRQFLSLCVFLRGLNRPCLCGKSSCLSVCLSFLPSIPLFYISL